MATAYVSGLFATGCHAAGTFCDTAASAAPIYELMRIAGGTIGTVMDPTGLPLSFYYPDTVSRFLSKKW